MSITVREFAAFDATGLSEEIRRGSFSAIEVLDASIAAIEKLNPQLNAVICKLYAQARDQLKSQPPSLPLGGVPFLAKDLIAEIAGTPLHEGSAFLRDRYRSNVDSELVARWRAAGLLILGKTNTPELGVKPDCEPKIHGATVNPWAPGYTTGGSSGGSAAAVAARLVPVAHANDAGGSIRVPAACCGLFGLKPARGRNPLGPYYGDVANGIACEHAVSRTVRDSALLLDLTSRPVPGEPYHAPKPAFSFLAAAVRPPAHLRIGMITEAGGEDRTDGVCVEACRKAAHLLAELGHIVEETKFTHDALTYHRRCIQVFAALTNWAIKDWARRTGNEPTEDAFEPFTWFLHQRGGKLSSGDYLLIIQDMQRHARDVARFFDRFDVMLTPTMMVPPQRLGYLEVDRTNLAEAGRRMTQYTFFCFIANGTGLPSASLPLHWSADGLPIGVLATALSEELLFSLSGQLEGASPWAARIPALCA
jgi:amidase